MPSSLCSPIALQKRSSGYYNRVCPPPKFQLCSCGKRRNQLTGIRSLKLRKQIAISINRRYFFIKINSIFYNNLQYQNIIPNLRHQIYSRSACFASCSSNHFFRSSPPPYPVSAPFFPITRWQGMMMEMRFIPFAVPTARTAFGLPSSSACC